MSTHVYDCKNELTRHKGRAQEVRRYVSWAYVNTSYGSFDWVLLESRIDLRHMCIDYLSCLDPGSVIGAEGEIGFGIVLKMCSNGNVRNSIQSLASVIYVRQI